MKLKLIKYNLNVNYVPGKRNLIADVLSRNYIKDKVVDDKTYAEVVHSATELAMSKSRLHEFVKETNRDETLQKLKNYFLNGWPESKHTLDSDT